MQRMMMRRTRLPVAAVVATAARTFSLSRTALQMSPPGGRPGGRPPPSGEDMRGFRGGAPPPPAHGERSPPAAAEAPPAPPKKPEAPPQFLSIEHSDKGVATIKMGRKPVNSINLEMFLELNQWLLWLGYDEATKAIILSSSIPMVYSAGLDINELHNPKPERFNEFWSQFQEMWMILNTFPKPVIAAINGNAPAGGCIIALCTDFRVMAKCPKGQPERPYRIGLNEVRLGIVAPPWVMGSMSYVVGSRKAERMLQLGETPTAQEAQVIGLVDAAVEEDEVMTVAQREVDRFLAIPNEARWMSKDILRRELFQFLGSDEERAYDNEFFGNMIQNPEVQKHIEKYLERLHANKK